MARYYTTPFVRWQLQSELQYITDNEVLLHEKYVTGYAVKNTMSYIMTTNSPVHMQDPEDRRYVVFGNDDGLTCNKDEKGKWTRKQRAFYEYCAKLHEKLNDPDYMGMCRQALKLYDLPEMTPVWQQTEFGRRVFGETKGADAKDAFESILSETRQGTLDNEPMIRPRWWSSKRMLEMIKERSNRTVSPRDLVRWAKGAGYRTDPLIF